MYNMKTASLFRFCCMSPFIMTNQSSKNINFAKKYGDNFGLIFQIIDDYLDEVGNYNKLGKTPGKDKKRGKSTLLQHLKKKKVSKYCENITDKFIIKNKFYFSKWKNLENLLLYIIHRSS